MPIRKKKNKAPKPAPTPTVSTTPLQEYPDVDPNRCDPIGFCTEPTCGNHKPHLHWVCTGFCCSWMPEEAHQKCPGMYATLNGKKVVNCHCGHHGDQDARVAAKKKELKMQRKKVKANA